MSPKRIHRDRRNSLSNNVFVRSKQLTTETNVNSSGYKNLRKRKKDIEFKEKKEPARKKKDLSTKLLIMHANDNISNVKKMDSDRSGSKDFNEFAISTDANSYLNKTPKTLRSLKQWSGKTKINTYSSKLLRSSPVIRKLTPYRRSKTPKKLPIMSPVKAHSIGSSKLFRKKPKRLTMTMDSLLKVQGNKTLPNDGMQLKLHISDTDLSTNCNLSKQCKTKSRKNTSMPVIGKKYSTRFSKSAKVILGSTKLKSKNSKTFTIDDFLYENTKLKQPIVLLQRLPNIITMMPPLLPLSSSMVKVRINDRSNDNNINVSRKIFDSVFNQSEKVLKRSNNKGHIRSASCNNDKQKQQLGITLCKLQNTTETHLHKKALCNKKTIIPKCHNANETVSKSLVSSTPKDKETLKESEGKNKRRKTSPQWDTSDKLIECSTCSNQNDVTVTMENEQGEMKGKNETYELIVPKTPKLRKQLEGKQGVKENRNLNPKLAEKNVKVRFTSSNTKSNYNIQSSNRLNEKKKLHDLKKSISKASLKKNSSKTTISITHRKSIYDKNTPAVDSCTPSQIGNKSTTSVNIATVTPFVSHSNTKSSSAKRCQESMKKMPNFSKIHNKMFAKLESIVDVKNRVKNKHAAYTTSRIDNSARRKINLNEERDQLSKELHSKTHDQFGFKMRKREATNCILRSRTLHSARRKQQSTAILKGVRTNRRFELQMKLRQA